MTLFYIPQRKTTTLSTVGGIDASQTTGIKLGSVTGIDITKPGIVAINWSNPIDDTKIEYISYTSIDGTNELQGVTRGAEDSTGRIHSNGVTVAYPVSSSHINNINDEFAARVVATGAEVDTGTDNSKYMSPKSFKDATIISGKRITKRVLSTNAPGATPTLNTDSYDVAHFTGLNTAITSMTSSLSGTPVQGDTLRIDFTDDGTARAIAWGTSFESSGNVTLPTTTVLGVRLDVGFFWNTVTSKWRCVAVA